MFTEVLHLPTVHWRFVQLDVQLSDNEISPRIHVVVVEVPCRLNSTLCCAFLHSCWENWCRKHATNHTMADWRPYFSPIGAMRQPAQVYVTSLGHGCYHTAMPSCVSNYMGLPPLPLQVTPPTALHGMYQPPVLPQPAGMIPEFYEQWYTQGYVRVADPYLLYPYFIPRFQLDVINHGLGHMLDSPDVKCGLDYLNNYTGLLTQKLEQGSRHIAHGILCAADNFQAQFMGILSCIKREDNKPEERAWLVSRASTMTKHRSRLILFANSLVATSKNPVSADDFSIMLWRQLVLAPEFGQSPYKLAFGFNLLMELRGFSSREFALFTDMFNPEIPAYKFGKDFRDLQRVILWAIAQIGYKAIQQSPTMWDANFQHEARRDSKENTFSTAAL